LPTPATRATIRASYRLAPGHTVAVVACAAVGSGLGIVQILLLAHLIGLIGDDEGSLLAPLVLIGLVSVTTTALRHGSGYSVEVIGQRLRGDAERRLMAMNMGPVGIAHLEDSKYLDFVETAKGQLERWGAANSIWGVTESMSTFLNGLTRAVVLLAFGWWAPLLLAGAAIALHRASRAQFENLMKGWQRDAEHLRRADYFRELTLTAEGAKEVRIFGLGPWLVDQFSATWLTSMRTVWRERTASVWQGSLVVTLAAGSLGLVAWRVGHQAAAGTLSIEALMVLVPSAIGLVESGLLSNAQVYATGASAALLAIEDAERMPPTTASQLPSGHRSATGVPLRDIRFDAVSFRYPQAHTDVLADFDLAIEAGSSVAIVGLNGAGKTTLIKLLARLYEPTAGRITVDGVDLHDFDLDSWRRRVSVVFQDFTCWKLSLRDNVGFGDLALADHDRAILEAIDRAQAGDLLSELPSGLDTVLSPEFDGGVDLSGGQWQRVALARALMSARDGGLLVLDEPTASLDVRAEAEIFDRFLEVTRGATTLLISHRFSTVRRADRIVVLDTGRVVEDGTHEALLALDGRYATLYRSQARHYTMSEGDR
jgi:ATP-binding cassette subfamily B protein